MDQYLNCKNAMPSLISRNTQNMVPLEDIGQNCEPLKRSTSELKPSKNPLHLPGQYPPGPGRGEGWVLGGT